MGKLKPRRWFSTVFLSALGLTFLLGYQNCAKTGFESKLANKLVASSSESPNVEDPVPTATTLGQAIILNGISGGTTEATRASVTGDIDLVYRWTCDNCLGSDVPTYMVTSCSNPSSGVVDWMSSLTGQHTVPAASARVGCDLNITRTVYGSTGTLTKTFYFRWIASSGTTTPQPTQWLTMNDVAGGTSASPGSVPGAADLRYNWGCTNCTSAEIPTYAFGGNCAMAANSGPATNIPISWMTGTSGEWLTPAMAERQGCYLNVTRTVHGPGGSNTRTFYFNWTQGGQASPSAAPTQWVGINGKVGGLTPSTRLNLKGDAEMTFMWSCTNCTQTVSATFNFGGNCSGVNGGATNAPIEWMIGPIGAFTSPGTDSRVGCWIDITRTVSGPNGSNTQTFYFNWVAQ